MKMDKIVQKNVPKNLAHLGVEDVLSHFYEPQPLSIISEANGGQNQARHQNNQLRSGNKRQTSAVVRELKRLKNPRASSTRSNGATVEQINRRNSRRKPSARRTSPFKKMMRRQKISPEVAQAMRGQPDKGDRRRTAAQRRVQEKYAARHRAVEH